MCTNCFEEMNHLPTKVDRKILDKKVYCAGVYEHNLQKLIRGLKYHNQKELAYYQAKFMYDYWQKILDKKEHYQIVPIPLYHTRQKARKYNHMELVAEEFAKLAGYETNFELVKRIKDTKPQYKLNKSQRMQNLENAFKIGPKHHKHSPILLLDDICTTGSTFENIILDLKNNNIDDIVCLATSTPFAN